MREISVKTLCPLCVQLIFVGETDMADAKGDRSWYRNYYREIDVLHGLQSTPDDRDWLLTTPKRRSQAV